MHYLRWNLLAFLFVLWALALLAEEPASPFGNQRPERKDARQGKIFLSDGKKLQGKIYLTRDKKLKIYDRKKKKHREFSLKDVAKIEVEVEEEHLEAVWCWKEMASDEKIQTGEFYPWRKYLTTIFLNDKDKTRITGDLTALLYIETRDKKKNRLILHKRHKGKVGQELKDLVYIKEIDFTSQSARPGKEAEQPVASSLP